MNYLLYGNYRLEIINTGDGVVPGSQENSYWRTGEAQKPRKHLLTVPVQTAHSFVSPSSLRFDHGGVRNHSKRSRGDESIEQEEKKDHASILQVPACSWEEHLTFSHIWNMCRLKHF